MYEVGTVACWKWMGRTIQGEVLEVHQLRTEKSIKGKRIVRNGTPENPAILVRSEAGNLALKLASELFEPEKNPIKSRIQPKMFADDSD